MNFTAPALRRMSSSAHPIVNKLPKMLCPSPHEYDQAEFLRQDESPDTQWYCQPRFVQHIDDEAIKALKDYYAVIIKPTSSVVDICSR